jgi:hypothetical protein
MVEILIYRQNTLSEQRSDVGLASSTWMHDTRLAREGVALVHGEA